MTFGGCRYRINGIRVRKSLSTKNEIIAKRKAKYQEQKLLKGESEGFRGRTQLESFWNEFLPFAKSTKRPKTVDNDCRIWQRFSNWLAIRNIKYVDQITSQLFETYRLYLQNEGLQKNSINIAHRHISSILSFAVRQGFIESNPLRKVKKFKIEQKAPKFLSKEEIAAVLKSAENHSREMHLVFALGIYGGFRRSEIANARWEWFDFENEIIVIQPFKKFIPKSHRMRPIPMNNNLKRILLKFKDSKDFLFNSNIPEDQRINLLRYDFKNGFRSVKRAAGIEWVTPHILRHTFASHLAKAGVSLYKIQQWLGHNDPKTTMIYAHLQARDDEINLI